MQPDYKKVYADIAAKLDNIDFDDGSYGPLLGENGSSVVQKFRISVVRIPVLFSLYTTVRLAWHASGTYSIKDGTGGSNGSTMRFASEAGWGANAGLKIARDLLQPIAEAHPGLSTADLWTLAGVVAIQQMGGPVIPWRPGRVDYADDSKVGHGPMNSVKKVYAC